MSLNAKGIDYANVIESWIKNNDLERLSIGARDLYITTNSWKAWGENFNLLLKSMKN